MNEPKTLTLDQFSRLIAHTIAGQDGISHTSVIEKVFNLYEINKGMVTVCLLNAHEHGYFKLRDGLLYVSARSVEDVIYAVEIQGRLLEEIGRIEEAKRVRKLIPLHYVDVVAAAYLHDTVLSVTFSDGLTGEVDLMDIFVGPLAEEIIAEGRVRDFAVDEEQGTIVWFNGLDIAPDRLWTSVLERRNSAEQQHQHDWVTDIPIMDDETSAPWEGPYECSCGKSAWLVRGVKTS